MIGINLQQKLLMIKGADMAGVAELHLSAVLEDHDWNLGEEREQLLFLCLLRGIEWQSNRAC
jgi:hypothetical protein